MSNFHPLEVVFRYRDQQPQVGENIDPITQGLLMKVDTFSYAYVLNKKMSRPIIKVIYHPLYGMNNYVLTWGDWLSCDPLRGSHDSQSPHIRKHLCHI